MAEILRPCRIRLVSTAYGSVEIDSRDSRLVFLATTLALPKVVGGKMYSAACSSNVGNYAYNRRAVEANSMLQDAHFSKDKLAFPDEFALGLGMYSLPKIVFAPHVTFFDAFFGFGVVQSLVPLHEIEWLTFSFTFFRTLFFKSSISRGTYSFFRRFSAGAGI